MPSFRRLWLSVVAVLALAVPSFAQITWNFTYQDGAGVGFNDNTVDPGETLSRGQLRRNSIDVATTYLNTVLDGRGTVNAQFGASQSDGSGALASYGPQQIVLIDGSFQNGGIYQSARTNQLPFSGTAGSGQFDFGYGWNYAGQNSAVSGSRYDMVTVAIHEIGHGLGFLSLANQNGVGLSNSAVGTPDVYSGLDRYLQRGSGAFNSTSRLFNTDISNSNYGAFTGLASTFTNGNDASTGLFFGGAFAREVNGGAPIAMFAPNPYQGGSSVSHVNDSAAVMNPSVTPNTVKRFQAYEIAMLMDAGWNVYNWNNTNGGTGNWLDGANNVANSRWRSDSGIVYNGAANGNQTFNTNSSQSQAPILPVYGQVTANIVLNFSNTGTTAYTSTNNVGSVRLSRLTFASTNATGTINIDGGTLNFGLNQNGSASVLVPKIRQSGSGAVNISSAIQTNSIATQTIDGVQFNGHNGVTIEGTGSGLVTISGNITGSGGLTKNGPSFNLVLSGTNSYTGATTVGSGSLFVNGNSSAATGTVSVNSGGVLTGNGTVGGAVLVNNGGRVEAGNSGIGTLAVTNNVTVNNGGTLRAELGASTADQLNMTGNNYILDLKNGTVVSLVSSGFNSSTFTYTLADLNGTGNVLRLNGANVATDTDLAIFTSTGGNAGSNSNSNLTVSLSGFNLLAGDKFTLRRASNGDFVLLFTPVPEPAGILVVCGLVTAGGLAWRRWTKRTPVATP